MSERDKYELPLREKKTINKMGFIVWCMIWMSITLVAADLLVFFSFPANVGYFPIPFAILVIDIFGLCGCVYYIRKHDYAYENNYEKYQIANAVIYGIQNILSAILVMLIISILVLPIYYIIIVLALVVFMFRLKQRIL